MRYIERLNPNQGTDLNFSVVRRIVDKALEHPRITGPTVAILTALTFKYGLPAADQLLESRTPDSMRINPKSADRNLGELDTHIAAITLLNGARFRMTPNVFPSNDQPQSNLIAELNTDDQNSADRQETTIDTPSGVRVLTRTSNGTWYGVSVEDLVASEAIIKHPDGLASSLHQDNSRIVWLNSQTSLPMYATDPTSAY